MATDKAYKAKFGHAPPEGMSKDAMQRWITSGAKKAPAPEGSYGPKGSVADRSGSGDAHKYAAEKAKTVGSAASNARAAPAVMASNAAKVRLAGKAGLAAAAAYGAYQLLKPSSAKADTGKPEPKKTVKSGAEVKDAPSESRQHTKEAISGVVGAATSGVMSAALGKLKSASVPGSFVSAVRSASRIGIAVGAATAAYHGVQAARQSYQTKDGRTVQATEAQAERYRNQRKD